MDIKQIFKLIHELSTYALDHIYFYHFHYEFCINQIALSLMWHSLYPFNTIFAFKNSRSSVAMKKLQNCYILWKTIFPFAPNYYGRDGYE